MFIKQTKNISWNKRLISTAVLCIPINFVFSEDVQALADESKRVNAIIDQRSIGITDILSHMGVGIILTRDFGSQSPRIESASVQGGVIRADKEIKSSIAPVLEAHVGFSMGERAELGPFVAFGFNDAAAEDFAGPITSAHAGLMLSVSGKDRSKLKGGSESSVFFNLGTGISFTPQAKTLGDGLQLGKPLPAGVSEIYYKYEERIGWNVIFSVGYSF